MMEDTLYNTTSSNKRKMTLDLNTPTGALKRVRNTNNNELLSSPDYQRLGLTLPELDKFYLQNHQPNMPTPCISHLFPPRSVSDDPDTDVFKVFSEACEKVNAENKLKQEQQEAEAEQAESEEHYDEEDMSSMSSSTNEQIVPLHSPIDMESQERYKLELKRKRNRAAASKCRRKKLEKIGKLEEKVNLLKKDNGDLTSTLNRLKDHVSVLKEQIMKHINSGCNIMVSTNFGS